MLYFTERPYVTHVIPNSRKMQMNVETWSLLVIIVTIVRVVTMWLSGWVTSIEWSALVRGWPASSVAEVTAD